MNPVRTASCNMMFRGNSTVGIANLWVERIKETKVSGSFWRPTEEELAALNAGGLVCVALMTEVDNFPPISVIVEEWEEIAND